MVGQSGLVPDGDGHTLLSPEDLEHLKLTHITTRGDLNEAEQLNILQAVAETRPPSVGELLDDLYLRRLHRRMFGDVWQWAGRYRMHETNLGADPDLIPAIVKDVVRDE
ncbi:MAG: hypothetical protein HYU28_12490 [Actinobacteria bacterium]|nr:hypothetical protein [Actinomycetota bacterium]